MTLSKVIAILEAKLERNDNPLLTAGIVYALTVLRGLEPNKRNEDKNGHLIDGAGKLVKDPLCGWPDCPQPQK